MSTDNPFSEYETDAGIVQMIPGITIVGIKYKLVFMNTLAQAVPGATFAWGFLVGPNTLDAADLDPNVNKHLDWMEWGMLQVQRGAGDVLIPLGNADDGFRSVRSMRKMGELDTALFSAVSAQLPGGGTWSYSMISSVAFKLP